MGIQASELINLQDSRPVSGSKAWLVGSSQQDDIWESIDALGEIGNGGVSQ